MQIEDLRDYIESSVSTALEEDIGSGDITAELIDEHAKSNAVVICREEATLCGTRWFDEVFRQLPGQIDIEWSLQDGQKTDAGQCICTLSGPTRSLLSGERTALNFLQTLSATATVTQMYAALISDTDSRLLDTRKTIPGLRLAQKYAVACGGGHNHRIGLFDAFLIKENHIIAAGSIGKACSTARSLHPEKLLEVEVENLDELDQALAANADRIMLDNFTLEDLHKAVEINAKRAELEASGNVDAHTLGHIAETGVDYISIGALTKNIAAIDLSMRFSDQARKQQTGL